MSNVRSAWMPIQNASPETSDGLLYLGSIQNPVLTCRLPTYLSVSSKPSSSPILIMGLRHSSRVELNKWTCGLAILIRQGVGYCTCCTCCTFLMPENLEGKSFALEHVVRVSLTSATLTSICVCFASLRELACPCPMAAACWPPSCCGCHSRPSIRRTPMTRQRVTEHGVHNRTIPTCSPFRQVKVNNCHCGCLRRTRQGLAPGPLGLPGRSTDFRSLDLHASSPCACASAYTTRRSCSGLPADQDRPATPPSISGSPFGDTKSMVANPLAWFPAPMMALLND